MTDFMIRLIGMSLQASVVIGVVLLLRLLFQKLNISKKYVMLLWVIPFICLILPWKITSPIGFWDSAPSEYGYESFTSSDEAEETPNDRVTSYNMISGWRNTDGTITLRCRRPNTDYQFRVTLKCENGTYHFVSQMLEV